MFTKNIYVKKNKHNISTTKKISENSAKNLTKVIKQTLTIKFPQPKRC